MALPVMITTFARGDNITHIIVINNIIVILQFYATGNGNIIA